MCLALMSDVNLYDNLMRFKFFILTSVLYVQSSIAHNQFDVLGKDKLGFPTETFYLEEVNTFPTDCSSKQENPKGDNLVLKNFKEVFETHPFSYRPFIQGVRSYQPLEQLTNVNISTFAVKNLSFVKEGHSNYADWRFSLCDEMSKIKKDSLYQNGNQSFLNSPSKYRFNDYIFSWVEYESLKQLEEKNSLIPYSLLEAIKQNNFELFFLQKEIQDDELHAVYLDVLHTSVEPHISKASPVKISDFATYMLIGGIICLFVSKYSNASNEVLLENKKINRHKNLIHYKIQKNSKHDKI